MNFKKDRISSKLRRLLRTTKGAHALLDTVGKLWPGQSAEIKIDNKTYLIAIGEAK